jgi:hypothetical protein
VIDAGDPMTPLASRSRRARVVNGIEQAQLELHGVLGEDRKIHTPAPSQVAPKGYGLPGQILMRFSQPRLCNPEGEREVKLRGTKRPKAPLAVASGALA